MWKLLKVTYCLINLFCVIGNAIGRQLEFRKSCWGYYSRSLKRDKSPILPPTKPICTMMWCYLFCDVAETYPESNVHISMQWIHHCRLRQKGTSLSAGIWINLHCQPEWPSTVHPTAFSLLLILSFLRWPCLPTSSKDYSNTVLVLNKAQTVVHLPTKNCKLKIYLIRKMSCVQWKKQNNGHDKWNWILETHINWSIRKHNQ